jgi:preprotein translocase subunit YajC
MSESSDSKTMVLILISVINFSVTYYNMVKNWKKKEKTFNNYLNTFFKLMGLVTLIVAGLYFLAM